MAGRGRGGGAPPPPPPSPTPHHTPPAPPPPPFPNCATIHTTVAMPLLEARELSKRYGAVVALRSATLVVEPGEVHALLGANGAGKSTLVKMLTGVIRPDSGTIAVSGRTVRMPSPGRATRLGLASVFQ